MDLTENVHTSQHLVSLELVDAGSLLISHSTG